MNTNDIRKQILIIATAYQQDCYKKDPAPVDNLDGGRDSAARAVRDIHRSLDDYLKRHFKDQSHDP